MAPINPQTSNDQPDDDLDAILNGIVQDTETSATNVERLDSNRPNVKDSDIDGALGIDEEVVITKKRVPIPKLDKARLVSAQGIPRLQKITKERLRFKGKGYEYRDIARMLNMYQLWLDDLFPRAKFADALTIIEKVGHSKEMQSIRKEWIEEGKPRRTAESDEEDVEPSAGNTGATQPNEEGMEGVEETVQTSEGSTEQAPQPPPSNHTNNISRATANDDPDEDELDALLAESGFGSTVAPKTLPAGTVVNEEDPFADEMEAMADIEDMW